MLNHRLIDKSKPRLLVVRFEPSASRLSEKLQQNAIFSQPLPLMEIQKSDQFSQVDHFFNQAYDYIIAVSGNAVSFTSKALHLKNITWPESGYLAIGKSTKAQLKAVLPSTMSDPISPTKGVNSEALLSLDALQSLEDKKILILRGVGGREYLRDTLQQRGATVDYYQPYQRISLDIKAPELIKICLHNKINGAIIASAELLNEFIALTTTECDHFFQEMTIFAPSQRIINLALKAGFKHAEVLPCLIDDDIVGYFNKT